MSIPATETTCVYCSQLELPRKCALCERDSLLNGYTDTRIMMQDTRSNTLEQLAKNVLEKLHHQGYCVVDKFHKEQTAIAILDEVRNIHENGHMHNGQLTNTLTSQSIRGDLIAWVDGREKGMENIALHMRRVDLLVRELNKMISYHRIEGRTQAMVACYPGGGKRYRKHVDNPNQDGRCITTIYYLNKDYVKMVNGGVLRIYPHGGDAFVDIEPLLDRLFLFWSDRRNPHEVLPAYSTRSFVRKRGRQRPSSEREEDLGLSDDGPLSETCRYAITLWYFDKEEREAEYQRLKVARERQVYVTSHGFKD